MKTMKKITAAALICALLMSMPGLGSLAASAQEENTMTISADQEKQNFNSAAADFSFKLFQNSLKEGENTVISPLSVYLALGMTANGADGNTRSQFETLLGGGKSSMEEINRNSAELLYNLRSNEDRTMRISNSIWFDTAKALHVNQPFLETNAKYYGAGVFQQNFKDAATLNQINNWVKTSTDGKIPSIIDKMDDDAIMYLINTILFEANWMNPYPENKVEKGTFHAPGSDVQATFMTSEETYLNKDGAKGMLKYFRDGHTALAAILPPDGMSADNYVKSLTGDKWNALLGSENGTRANAHLPKFKFEYDIKMAPLLQKMGLTDAFSVRDADFKTLGTYENRNISINEVLHKAFIEVDEAGAKAGAATAVEMIARMSMPIGEPVELKFDKPFVCAIVDTDSGLPIFLATIQKPAVEA